MSLSLIEELAQCTPDDEAAILAQFTPDELALLATSWDCFARPEQLAPAWPWDYWLLLGGRGAGKTRPSAEQVHQWAEQPVYIALVGETAAEVRDVMIEGVSGLLLTAKPWNPCTYYPSKRRVVWKSGAWATTYSGDAPDQLRGPNAHYAWVDELAKFKYPQETWDNLELILRAGTHPQGIVSTTPRPIPIVKTLLADTEHVALSRYSTYTNWANLATSFIERVVRRYEGTRLGRQELHAEVLGDTPGALWNRTLIEQNRVTKHPPLRRIVVAIDPGHDAGIVAMGIDAQGVGYVLEDLSVSGSPTDWAKQAVAGYHRLKADRLVAEHNHGGEMVFTTIQTVDETVIPKMVWASKGKYARAEPVSALSEQGRIKHVGMCAGLEDELVDWVPDEGMPSPNRLDAFVWAATELMLGESAPPLVAPLIIGRR